MEELEKEEFVKIENDIDLWIYSILDENIPRYKYIYHCNLAYIEILVNKKVLFSIIEKHFVFSLSYNTYIAYKKLKEEDNVEFSFDESLFKYCYKMLLKGMQYSVLCDIFPMVHSKKAKLLISRESGKIEVVEEYIPRKVYDFINRFSTRKTLSYILQISAGKMQNMPKEDTAIELSKIYIDFWNESLLFEDFQEYSRIDWGGVNLFFTLAAMRRFLKLYQNDFNIIVNDLPTLMIVLSPDGVNKIKEYIPTNSIESLKKILDGMVYKPLGKALYPKLSIEDAPLIKTKDGYIFTNPLLLLYNNSNETRLLNFLRKFEQDKYLKIKDKIKERGIPLIIEMIKYKIPSAKVISNFNVTIPNSKGLKRECDLLIIDGDGYAVYFEIKDFYNPISYCERKNLDGQFNLALDKIPDQLTAISSSWDHIKQLYGIEVDINQLKGVIVSQMYLGYDVRKDKDILLIDTTTLYESIAKVNSIRDVYQECKEIDDTYAKVNLITRKLDFTFANYDFSTNIECLDPVFETLFNKFIKDNIFKMTKIGDHKNFNNLKDVAKEYIDKMVKH